MLLEKLRWTTDDFEAMGWHDVDVYEVRIAKNEVSLVIDYRFEEEEDVVWIAPATLTFVDVSRLVSNLVFEEPCDFEIVSILRNGNEWTIEFDCGGEMRLNASGFEQLFRGQPVRVL